MDNKTMPLDKKYLIGLVTVMAITLSACQPAGQTAPPFQPALDKHLAAVTGRDLPTFVSTLTTGEKLPMIFPNGSKIDTIAEIESFHKGWFADDKWVFKLEPVHQVVGSDMAVALMKTSYQDTADGAARYGYLALTFKLENGEWRLVHDQNTRITETQ